MCSRLDQHNADRSLPEWMNYMQQSYLGVSEYRTASSADHCGSLKELRLSFLASNSLLGDLYGIVRQLFG